MNHLKPRKLFSALTALVLLSGVTVNRDTEALLRVYAEDAVESGSETEASAMVTASTTRFVLTGGTLDNASYAVENGVAVLKDGVASAEAPVPQAPALSNLVFDGWRTADNTAAEEYSEDQTYYAAWQYSDYTANNTYSDITYYLNHSNYYDFTGASGLKITYRHNGYSILYRIGDSQGTFRKNNLQATGQMSEDLYLTPVFSFCNVNGEISENAEENLFVKVSYLIQNRGAEDITAFDLASIADVQIGSNDHAAIYGYTEENEKLKPVRIFLMFPISRCVEMITISFRFLCQRTHPAGGDITVPDIPMRFPIIFLPDMIRDMIRVLPIPGMI